MIPLSSSIRALRGPGEAFYRVLESVGVTTVEGLLSVTEEMVDRGILNARILRAKRPVNFWRATRERCLSASNTIKTQYRALPVPDEFCCPITCDFLADAVITPSGYTYSRAPLLEFLSKTPRDPITQQPLNASQLIPNRAAQECADYYRRHHMLVYPFV